MSKYGTYTTLDTPCLKGQGAGVEPSKEQIKLITKAKCHLSEWFNEIGGRVRTLQNPHDFGTYPSFEIDYSDRLNPEFIDTDIECVCGDCGECKDITALDNWHDKANDITEKYSKMFADYL